MAAGRLKQLRVEFAANPSRSTCKATLGGSEVFRTLLGPAIKYTPESGSVLISISAERSYAEVAITDTGRGIAREALPKIFTPFVQLGTPGSRRRGLGLGLSIAQRVVAMHGGSIHAESEGPHRGATFRVRLPLFAPN